MYNKDFKSMYVMFIIVRSDSTLYFILDVRLNGQSDRLESYIPRFMCKVMSIRF